MIAFLLVVTALIAYFAGGVYGTAVAARYLFRRRLRAPANVGIAKFYRRFGAVGAAAAAGIDIVKSLLVVLIGGWLLGTQDAAEVGRLFAGFCLILGTVYPARYGFRGGNGLLCAGIAALLADWRAGLLCCAVFAVVLLFTRYTALASVLGALVWPLWMLAFNHSGLEVLLALFCALLIVVKHAENILRLLGGTEPKLGQSGTLSQIKKRG